MAGWTTISAPELIGFLPEDVAQFTLPYDARFDHVAEMKFGDALRQSPHNALIKGV